MIDSELLRMRLEQYAAAWVAAFLLALLAAGIAHGLAHASLAAVADITLVVLFAILALAVAAAAVHGLVSEETAAGKAALAIGPGIPTDSDMTDLVRRLASESTLPMVIDADALNVLAAEVDLLARAPAARLLTPHPGEMARLL